MHEWHKETCIRFKPKANTGSDQLFIRMRSDQDGCWSLLGRQLVKYGVGQDVSIGKGCATHSVVVHELGHAIGFHHEQSRSDRDSAIHINYQNVEKEMNVQFNKENDINFGVPYDITSVMQYPSWAFSKDVFVKQTIVTKDPKLQRLLNKSDGLTFRDKKTANLMYNCNKDCPNKDLRCLNEGYLSPYKNDGQKCFCVCPPTAIGKRCETVINIDYYDAIERLPCGGNITEEGHIQTPDYPNRIKPFQSCAWIITAPNGKLIRVTFEGFEFAQRANKPGTRLHGKCYDESVELRLNDRYNGQLYCATDIAKGSTFTSRSSIASIIVIADKSMIGKGLKANIQFVDKRRRISPRTNITTN
ncbi:blastula protease 10-like protein, partial [Leptotrombidium deliense]